MPLPFFGPPDVEKLKAARNVAGLIKALDYQKDLAVRRSAIHALADLKDARAVQPLIAALKGSPWIIRSDAAAALKKLKDGHAVQPFVAALKDPALTAIAAKALGELMDVQAVQPLIDALKIPERARRSAVARALGQIKDPRALDEVILALQDRDQYVRMSAASALGWRTYKPLGFPYTVMALMFPGHDVDSCCALENGGEPIEP